MMTKFRVFAGPVLLLGAFVLGLVPTIATGQGQTAPSTQPAAGAAKTDNLPMPVDEIIRRFAQHESDFKIARDNYTYSQTVLVQVSDTDGRDGGKYEMASDIVFTPAGKRYEKVTYAPQSTLRLLSLTPEDMKDIENIQPFVLTTEELPKYNVEYTGREKIDELMTYAFQVAPKRMEKGQRYFQGTIWVDDHDLAVVKSDGKAVPDIVTKNGENRFPRFVTYRENIEADFWFPTYTRADDTLHFKDGDIRMRMTVRYKNYKRFGTTIKIGESKEADQTLPNSQPVPPSR
jgi:hypothetical protein